MTVESPNRLWVADLTYLRTEHVCLCLAVVIEACTRMVVRWAMVDHLRIELVLDAVGMAINTGETRSGLNPPQRPVGPRPYTAYDFGRILCTSGILASMCRVGSALGNAMVERFFATPTTELVYRPSRPTWHELEMRGFSYLDGFYSRRRCHSQLSKFSPIDYEPQLMTQIGASA